MQSGVLYPSPGPVKDRKKKYVVWKHRRRQNRVYVEKTERGPAASSGRARVSGRSGQCCRKDRWVSAQARARYDGLCRQPTKTVSSEKRRGKVDAHTKTENEGFHVGCVLNANNKRHRRRVVYMSHRNFKLSPEALQILSNSQRRKKLPQLVWAIPRTQRNREVHALVGNGVEAGTPWCVSRHDRNRLAHSINGNTAPDNTIPELGATPLAPTTSPRRRLSEKSHPTRMAATPLASQDGVEGTGRLTPRGSPHEDLFAEEGVPTPRGVARTGESDAEGVPMHAGHADVEVGSASSSSAREVTTFDAMWGHWECSARRQGADLTRDHHEDAFSIIRLKDRLVDMVQEAWPAVDRDLQQLAVGVLATSNLRLINIRDEVAILHIIEGGRHLRAFNGVAYFYDPCGAWLMHTGVTPAGTVGRVSLFMIRLEGAWRRLPANTGRDERALMEALRPILQPPNASTVEILRSLEIFTPAKNLRAGAARRARPHSDVAEGEDDPDGHAGEAQEQPYEQPPDDSATMAWTAHVASCVARLAGRMQNAILSTRLLSYYTEWCDLGAARPAGIAFEDACVCFDRTGSVAQHRPKSPLNEVFFYMPHALLDPVLEQARDRTDLFFRQTFYANEAAFRCNIAALSLALRGVNVDRAFWGVGAGGVGQSLFTAHLAALLGRLHAYLDTNIYYTDDEFRTSSPQLSRCPGNPGLFHLFRL